MPLGWAPHDVLLIVTELSERIYENGINASELVTVTTKLEAIVLQSHTEWRIDNQLLYSFPGKLCTFLYFSPLITLCKL